MEREKGQKEMCILPSMGTHSLLTPLAAPTQLLLPLQLLKLQSGWKNQEVGKDLILLISYNRCSTAATFTTDHFVLGGFFLLLGCPAFSPSTPIRGQLAGTNSLTCGSLPGQTHFKEHFI